LSYKKLNSIANQTGKVTAIRLVKSLNFSLNRCSNLKLCLEANAISKRKSKFPRRKMGIINPLLYLPTQTKTINEIVITREKKSIPKMVLYLFTPFRSESNKFSFDEIDTIIIRIKRR
jgi:hypothetical protein